MTPRFPSLEVKIPNPPDIIRLSVRIGWGLKESGRPEEAAEWYQAAKWAKNWPAILALGHQWVTLVETEVNDDG